MRWLLAVLTPLAVGGAYLAARNVVAAVAAYHGICAVAILAARKSLAAEFAKPPGTATWSLGASALMAGAVVALAAAVTPDPALLETIRRDLFPWPPAGFLAFAVYSILVHVPLEETFWRGVVLGAFVRRGGVAAGVGVNVVCFWLVHAVPLVLIFGPAGWMLSVPPAVAGAAWAGMRIRAGTLWPGLASHAAADAAILACLWRLLAR